MASIYRAAFASLGFALSCSGAHADLSISNKATHDMSCSAGVCTASAKGANLNVSDLTNMLASGDITVKTGGGAVTIQVQDGFSWTSNSRLTLDANHSIGIHKPVLVAGPGAFTITYNDGGADGDLLFFGEGKIDFFDLNSNLIINGNSFVLAGDLKTLAQDIVTNADGSYALANDYDASADGKYGGSPVPTEFSGNFEGLGHTVSNVTVLSHKKYSIGLFYSISGIARDLTISNVKISCPRCTYVGGLAGGGSGAFSHIAVQGEITGGIFTGGLFGLVSGTVTDASAQVTVNAVTGAAGGIAGYATANIVRSRTTGSITGYKLAGGFAGEGGFADQSFSTAEISGGADRIGGLYGGLNDNSVITNSYSLGPVHGGGEAGGIVGRDYKKAQIINSYAAGSVVGNGLQGGFAGLSRAAVFANDYWDVDTTGQQNACGLGNCEQAMGLSDEQMKSGLPDGFDPNIWGQSPNINNGYPYLLANPPQ